MGQADIGRYSGKERAAMQLRVVGPGLPWRPRSPGMVAGKPAMQAHNPAHEMRGPTDHHADGQSPCQQAR